MVIDVVVDTRTVHLVDPVLEVRKQRGEASFRDVVTLEQGCKRVIAEMFR